MIIQISDAEATQIIQEHVLRTFVNVEIARIDSNTHNPAARYEIHAVPKLVQDNAGKVLNR